MTDGGEAPAAYANDRTGDGGSPAHRRRRLGASVIAWLAVLLCLAGWWVSYQLLRASFEGAPSNPFITALCGDENNPGGCMSVLRSERAKIFSGGKAGAGFPWAGMGMAYFAFAGVWYLFVGVPDRSRLGWHVIIALVIGGGALASIDLTLVMKSELRTWCTGCLIVHGINTALVLLTVAAFFAAPAADGVAPASVPAPVERASVPVLQGAGGVRAVNPTASQALATLLAATAIFALHVKSIQLGMVSGSAQQMMRVYRDITDDPEYVRWRYAREAPADIPLRDDEPWLGDSAAPNTVVAFIDFQCPVCKNAAEMLKQMVERYPDKLRVTFRHFPQDSACNAAYDKRHHLAACDAARAAEAARLTGGPEAFARMRTLLYERQRDLELGNWREWAASIGLDTEAFEVNMRSPKVDERIREDTALGGRLGVTAIPALYLNGRKFVSWSRPETWAVLLDDRPAGP